MNQIVSKEKWRLIIVFAVAMTMTLTLLAWIACGAFILAHTMMLTDSSMYTDLVLITDVVVLIAAFVLAIPLISFFRSSLRALNVAGMEISASDEHLKFGQPLSVSVDRNKVTEVKITRVDIIIRFRDGDHERNIVFPSSAFKATELRKLLDTIKTDAL